MARTVQEIRVQRGFDDVRNFAAGWFNNNGFKVLEWQSKGEELTHWHLTARWKIRPKPGSIVAIQASSITNAVLFELTMVPEGPSTLLHGEFYVPAAGFLGGKEMDVSENPGMNAMIPRKRGYALMVSFLQALGQMPGPPPSAIGLPPPQFQQQPQPQQPQPLYQPQPMPQPQQQPPPQQQYQQPMAQPPSVASGSPQSAFSPQQAPPPSQPTQYQTPTVQSTQPPQTVWPGAPSQAPQPVAQSPGQVGTQQQTFYCMYCGTPLPPIAKFCVHCGRQAVRPNL